MEIFLSLIALEVLALLCIVAGRVILGKTQAVRRLTPAEESRFDTLTYHSTGYVTAYQAKHNSLKSSRLETIHPQEAYINESSY